MLSDAVTKDTLHRAPSSTSAPLEADGAIEVASDSLGLRIVREEAVVRTDVLAGLKVGGRGRGSPSPAQGESPSRPTSVILSQSGDVTTGDAPSRAIEVPTHRAATPEDE
ncbi:hypothetical protein FRC11_010265, partial [Ceratobasidium sp. 423]